MRRTAGCAYGSVRSPARWTVWRLPRPQGVPVAGRPLLVLIDDLGHTHHLEFGAHDYVTLLGS